MSPSEAPGTRSGPRQRESSGGSRKYRNYPQHSLEEALVVAQKIQDEMGGKPFKRLLADALGIKPSSSNYCYLLSSSLKYGLTEGTEKPSDITLTKLGADATQTTDSSKRITASRKAAMTPPVFGRFYSDYADRKMPSPEMIGKILASEYDVPESHTDECARYLQENDRFTSLVRDIGGSPHVLLDAEPVAPEKEVETDPGSAEDDSHQAETAEDEAVDASGDGATPLPTPSADRAGAPAADLPRPRAAVAQHVTGSKRRERPI